jgi:hypothetical protein
MVATAVFSFLESPRRRRRFMWVSIGVVAALAAAVTIVLLPGRSHSTEKFSSRPAQVADTRQPRLRPAERRKIQRTVDQFVLAALDRSNPALAWKLAGPDLRGSTSAHDWVAGRMPIPVFHASETRFHGWTNVVIHPDSVLFDVVVQPRAGTKSGAIAYNGEVIRRGRGWAVNRWYPVATFSAKGERPTVVGPNDFGAAAPSGGSQTSSGQGTLGAQWIAVPAGLFALGLAVVIFVIGRNVVRYRRARRGFATAESREMPTLPGRGRPPAEPPGR